LLFFLMASLPSPLLPCRRASHKQHRRCSLNSRAIISARVAAQSAAKESHQQPASVSLSLSLDLKKKRKKEKMGRRPEKDEKRSERKK
jgi:hypothetical protein